MKTNIIYNASDSITLGVPEGTPPHEVLIALNDVYNDIAKMQCGIVEAEKAKAEAEAKAKAEAEAKAAKWAKDHPPLGVDQVWKRRSEYYLMAIDINKPSSLGTKGRLVPIWLPTKGYVTEVRPQGFFDTNDATYIGQASEVLRTLWTR